MKIDGRCHCGAISFEAEVDPASVSLCHCTDCQMLTGTAFRTTIAAPAASFTLRGATPVSYLKTADSGKQRRHAFCGTCGTPVFACAPENPATYSLRVGTIAQRHQFAAPKQQGWRRSALAWVDDLARITRYEKARP